MHHDYLPSLCRASLRRSLAGESGTPSRTGEPESLKRNIAFITLDYKISGCFLASKRDLLDRPESQLQRPWREPLLGAVRGRGGQLQKVGGGRRRGGHGGDKRRQGTTMPGELGKIKLIT